MPILIKDTNPDSHEALACLSAYYRVLSDNIQGVTPDMLVLPLPDADKYRPPRGVFLIATSEDSPMGCVSLRPLEPGCAEIKRLWIDPAARGQGLGRRLMGAIESRARDLGYSRLKLDSNAVLRAAIMLYRSDGWVDAAPYTSFPANIWLAKHL